MILITFTRGADPLNIITEVKPEPSSALQKKLMGDNVANITFFLSAMYNFNINDRAEILGETYYITKPVLITKHSKYGYEYTVVMETQQCWLRKAQFLFYDSLNVLNQTSFSFTGTADDFMNLLVLNANRVAPGWLKGGVIATTYKTLTFQSEDCLSVLSKIAQTFDTEFYIQNKYIHLATRQNLTSTSVVYGRDKGLYKINRQLIEDTIFTRLYVFGGTQNLPLNYRNFSPRLLMNSEDHLLVTDVIAKVNLATPVPGVSTYIFTFTTPTDPGATGLTIEYANHSAAGAGIWITDIGPMTSPRLMTLTPGDYDFRFRTTGTVTGVTESVNINSTDKTFFQKLSILEKNINIHGLIEGSLIVEDITPQRESKVTASTALNIYKFKDTTLDFDINAYLVPGVSAKVVFNTGQLAGYRFEISKYNAATQEITILKNKDEKALDLPSTFLRPGIGDSYILIDILLPQAYVIEAEKKLRKKATEYLKIKSDPAYKYIIECDPIYFRKNKIVLQVGDIIHLKDIELQVERNIRILTLTRALADEFEYTLELGDLIKPDLIASIQSGIINNAQTSQATNQQLNNSALFNGTYIGTFNVEQGTVKIKDIEIAASTAAMKQLFIDAEGKVWKTV